MMARSTTRSNQRPDTLMQDRICQVDETSCNARPDHTYGSKCEELNPSKACLRFLNKRTLDTRHVTSPMGQYQKSFRTVLLIQSGLPRGRVWALRLQSSE